MSTEPTESAGGQDQEDEPRITFAKKELDQLDALLKKYVTKKYRVRYAEWRAHPADREGLQSLLTRAGELNTLEEMNPEERRAFYLNAYNMMALDLVLRRYPETMGSSTSPLPQERSILNIGNVGERILEEEFWTVAGGQYSLKTLLDEELRPREDPRIRFAAGCGAIGCGLAHPAAYRAAGLGRVLDGLAAAYVNASENTFIYRSLRMIRTNPIFEWYAEDFEDHYGSLFGFFARYGRDLKEEQVRRMKIEFIEFDWRLNEKLPEPQDEEEEEGSDGDSAPVENEDPDGGEGA